MSPSSPKLLIQVSLLLVASLGANVYLLTRPSPPPPRSPPVRAEIDERTEVRESECVEELEACHRAASGLALGLWEAAMRPSPKGPPSAPASAPPPPAPKVESPRESLCRVARNKLRDQWLEKRESIREGLARDLPDTKKQRADAEKDAQKVSETLGLSGRVRRGFEDDYVDLRVRRIADIATLSQAPTIDWSKVLEQVKALFAGEDALVRQELGDEVLQRYKASESDGRITVLSIVATYADADWDQAVAGP